MEESNTPLEKVHDILSFMGLNKNERLIYLDLLRNGTSTALEISRRLKIHRPNAYDSLHKLVKDGFVAETKNSLKHSFQAMSINKLKDYLEQKKTELESVIPFIDEFAASSDTKDDVFITQGAFAARAALLDLLSVGEEISVYGASKEALNALGVGFLKDFHAQRIKKKVIMKHIYNEDVPVRINQLNAMKYTEARHLPQEYDSLVATLLCGDCTLLITFSNPQTIITLKSKPITDTYKKYFDFMWKRAK